MSTEKRLIADIMSTNPVRRGFILDAHDDIVLLLSGGSNEIKQLSQRLANVIVRDFNLDDCEVMCMGKCPISGELSFAVVRILEDA